MLTQKKVPRRGLGVAELERIRLEAQHKNNATLQAVHCLNSRPASNPSSILSPMSSTIDRLGVPRLEPNNLTFQPCSMLQRSQQHQQTSRSSSLMEPPSNQSYNGFNRSPPWPEEVKMVGVKRPYPFSPEFQPVPAFQCKLPQSSVAPVPRSHESAPSNNTRSVNVEGGNTLRREVPSNSRVLFESKPSRLVIASKTLNPNFLRLAPPTAAFPHSEAVNCGSPVHETSRDHAESGEGPHPKESSINSAPQSLKQFHLVPSQVVAAETTALSGLSRSVKNSSIRFFPSTKMKISQEGTHGRCHSEVGGNVDLELKL